MKQITVRARTSRVSRRLAILIVSGFVPGVLFTPAQAAEVSIKSSVSQKISFNDNPGLSPDSAGAVLTSRTSLAASILAKMPTFVIGTNLSISYNAYAGPGRGSRENGYDFSDFNFNATKTLNDTTTFTASGSFAVDNTATTQIDETGITDFSTDQFTLKLNGGVNRDINRNNSVSLNVAATSVSFSEGATAFTPYIDANVSGQWTHLVNSNIQTGLTSTIGIYQADGASDLRRFIFNAGGNASVQVTKTLSVNGGLGLDVASAESSGVMPASSNISAGFSGNFSANYQGRRTRYALSISQSLDPSASGELVDRTRFSLNATHNIPVNARSNATLAAAYAYRRSSSPMSSETAIQTITVSPTYSIELTSNVNANLGYTFTYRDSDGEKAHSNLVYFSITRSGTLLP